MVSITGMRGEPAAAEASMTLQQRKAHCVFSQGTCPWIVGPWPWWAAQTLGGGGEVWIVTYACPQYSWWQQQQA